MSKPLILVSNDDGIHAEGLQCLVAALKNIANVVVVAPDYERSASSHSLTLHRPLRIVERADNVYTTTGTPTDCVMLGVMEILKQKPDLVVSGINHGPNIGDDIHYSGTVAAAREAGLLGIPSFAISLATFDHFQFQPAARFAVKLAEQIFEHSLPADIMLNVNVPNGKTDEDFECVITSQGKRTYGDHIIKKSDPRGKPYYWLGGGELGFQSIPGSDCDALQEKKIAVTPLKINQTDFDMLSRLRTWKL
ncbi:MAG: 5'/3'-nucleotidase SurE [Deltaproteobacteria bacterium CG_4_10_14_0_2_um_filter_43_8]|nr:MAG: 5'/3'-nucleotidase SurE [Deltaproteobacteria bacterium CG11_big_fil_rev_8_21_14_0_20_42_23]PJA22381.1 MAG: 5'/3'-nucleotidase SurE [Deltaproteobacteria bacterium CG_4_10_14_0_2_um_filter_43_8]PJC64411.1 MAG: 5'/3'-nucleotidase SurE [Deltaproteobacteria bacterium CG_4_9_14_0_2_um_filter_42_21]